jgi:tetratricopeptide (TPR) repeat protein
MSIAKAFLSHSSKDKEFVRAVAQELGRQHCIFDEQVFETGNDFKKSIQDGLDSSSVFVFFASNNSISSNWVDFELQEAWYRKLEKKLQKSLVYMITDSVDIDSLPQWLKRAKVHRGNVPKFVARDIRNNLDTLIEERKNPFVGRTEDIKSLQEALTPADYPPPHIFFVTGLPGIGRRSLIQKVVEDSLGLKPLKSPFRLGQGFCIQDICVSVANLIEPYNTDEHFQKIMKEIQNLSEENALRRTIDNLHRLTNNGELPIFIDDGGLFDNDGNIFEPVQSIINNISLSHDIYIAFVSSRRPHNIDKNIARINLNPLKKEDQTLLIRTIERKYARDSETEIKKLKPTEISELAEYTAGYPPSAYATMELIEEYGIDIVMADKKRFVEHRIDQFIKYFSDKNLCEVEKSILCLLASYSPLPVKVISSVISQKMNITCEKISRLIDLSLVVLEGRMYKVSDPIEEAASINFGLPDSQATEKLVHSIIEIINNPDYKDQRLELHRIVYRASWSIEDKNMKNKVIFLFNDLIKIIRNFYDRERDYNQVIKATEIALAKCNFKSDRETILSYKIKSFVHLEKWTEAEQEMQIFKEYASLKNFYYLEGFLKRKQRKNEDAINAYLESYRYGKNDEAIHRELGQCYLVIGDYQNASYHVKEALERVKIKKRADFYVLDLQVQIAMALGDIVTAQESIDQLQDSNQPLYFYRKSKLEFLLGDNASAERYAEDARNSDKNPRFQVLANLAFLKIVNSKIEDAEKILNQIDRKFPKTNLNVRKGLRARLAIACKKYDDAYHLSNEIQDKSSKSYKCIRRDALQGYLSSCYVPDEKKEIINAELSKIKSELTSTDDSRLIFDIDNYYFYID